MQGVRQQLNAEAPSSWPAAEPPAILVVNDDASTLTALTAALEATSATVVGATSGAEALRELARRRFALILLDINMKDLDG